ncbi:hypothetical protein [Fibrobacter sp. UWS1]|uniref:hypothetical protein n=1 Tax=Fibrobacter sp. UWS1 TaxID=1896220 RepID=UPI001179F5E5|nr:hypothetical protein [Fibrobacter sp. UWS1]
MYRPPKSHAQTSLFCSLEEQLNHKHSLYVLANKIDWNKFETEQCKACSSDVQLQEGHEAFFCSVGMAILFLPSVERNE